MEIRRMSSYDPRGVRTPESAAEAKESLSRMLSENEELKHMLTRTLDELETVCKREDDSFGKLKKLEKGLGVQLSKGEDDLPATIDTVCAKLSTRQKLSQLEQEFQFVGLKIDGTEKKLQAKLLQICLASSQDDLEDMMRNQEVLRLEEKARENLRQNVMEEAAVDLARQQILVSATEKQVQQLTNEVEQLRGENAKYSRLEAELESLRTKASRMQSDKERIVLLEKQIAMLRNSKGPRERRWQVPDRRRNEDSTPSSPDAFESSGAGPAQVTSMVEAMRTPLRQKGRRNTSNDIEHQKEAVEKANCTSPSDYPTDSPYTPPSPPCHGLARVGTGRIINDEEYIPLSTELEKTDTDYEPDAFSPEVEAQKSKVPTKTTRPKNQGAAKGKENMKPRAQSRPKWKPPVQSMPAQEPQSGTTIHTHLPKDRQKDGEKQNGQGKKKRKLLSNQPGQEYADTLPANLLFGDIHNFKIPKLRK